MQSQSYHFILVLKMLPNYHAKTAEGLATSDYQIITFIVFWTFIIFLGVPFFTHFQDKLLHFWRRLDIHGTLIYIKVTLYQKEPESLPPNDDFLHITTQQLIHHPQE